MTIYLSNDFATLFALGAERVVSFPLFAKKKIIVPHPAMKDRLLREIVKTHRGRIAFGVEVMTFIELLKQGKKPFPSEIELALTIKNRWDLSLIQAKEIAARLISYSFHGKPVLSKEDEEIWKEISSYWNLEWTPEEVGSQGKLLFLGFSFVSRKLLEIIASCDGEGYFFSPCSSFWADFASTRAVLHLQPKLSEKQTDSLSLYLSEQHPLLANLGFLGKKMQIDIEEGSFAVNECYVQSLGKTALQMLQNDLLEGVRGEYFLDGTIIREKATSPLEEVELLREFIIQATIQKGILLEEILVVAPDMKLYASYIEMVFQTKEPMIPYSILGLKKLSPIEETFSLWIDLMLCEGNISLLQRLLMQEPLRERFELDSQKICAWLDSLAPYRIEQGLDCLEDIRSELIESLSFPRNSVFILNQDRELFDRFLFLFDQIYEDVCVCRKDKKGAEWFVYFEEVLIRFFGLEEALFLIEKCRRYARHLMQMKGDFEEKKISFDEMGPWMQETLGSRGYRQHLLGGVRFVSLMEGAIDAARVIAVLGVDEESFPRVDQRSKLYKEGVSKQDVDKDLVLQIVSSARDYLWMSYVAGFLRKELSISFLFDDLWSLLCKKEKDDREDFVGIKTSYFKKKNGKTIEDQTILPSWSLVWDVTDYAPFFGKKMTLDIAQLMQVSRDPLKQFLQVTHQLMFPYEENVSSISPHIEKQLVIESMFRPHSEVLSEALDKGMIPKHALKNWFVSRLIEQIEVMKEQYRMLEIRENDRPHMFVFEMDVELQENTLITVTGELPLYRNKLLLHESYSFENTIRSHPKWILGQIYQFPLYYVGQELVEERSTLSVEESKEMLRRYLEYYLASSLHGSPLIRPWICSLLQKEWEHFASLRDRSWSQFDLDKNSPLAWLIRKPIAVDTRTLYGNWSSYLKEVFCGRI